ncbi:MAG: hypothetical protein LQ343_003914 [Gyalolechia ehrenbergii]|nr:MAG: hypothetical protein LQ343_003914 [Gyalolechia ehrenbergii]
MSRPLGEPAPPAPQIRCTLYFYTWACGHKEWVNCSKCNLDEPNKYQAHLQHEHREVELPEPRHPCPVCNHPPPLEEQLASLDSPLMLEIRRNLAVVNSCWAVRNARAAEDVDAKENPWRHGFDDIDMTPDDRLTNLILMDNWQTTQHATRLEEWQRGFGTQGQPSGPESDSTVRPPPKQAAEESTIPTPGSQQTTPRQSAPRQLATGQAASSQQPGGHGRGQSSASTQQTSEPGLPVPNLIPNHLLALLIPQLAYTHPSNTQWGSVQQGQVRHTSHHHHMHRHSSHQSQPSGFEPSNVPQQQGGSMAFGSAERGPGYGQVRNTLQSHPQHPHLSHHRQPSFFGPGSATRGRWQQGPTTGHAGQPYGQHSQSLHHTHPHPRLAGGAPYSTRMPHGSGSQQHQLAPSRGAYQRGAHQQQPAVTRGDFHQGSSHVGTSNQQGAPSQLERSESVRQATSLSLPTTPVGSSPEGGSAEHGGQAQGGDVEQAAEEVEALHISERGRGGAGQGRGGSGTASAQRR